MKQWILTAALLLLVVLIVGSEIDQHLTAIEAWIAHLGPWSLLAFVGLFAVAASLFVPDTLLCIAAGALFGVRWGLAAVVVGSFVAAAVQFWIAHRFLRSRIQHMIGARPRLVAIQRGVMQDELRLQFLLRLTPLNPATASYLLGAAGVRFAGFMTACLAITPHLALEVYFGDVGRHLAKVAAGTAPPSRVHTGVTLVGLVIAIAVMVVLARTARRALTQAMDTTSSNNC